MNFGTERRPRTICGRGLWARGGASVRFPEAGGRWEPPRNNSRFDCLRESRAKLDPGSD